MCCPTWLLNIMSYYPMLSYELSYLILHHPRLSLMVISRLSLKVSVVRKTMFFNCNQGLVTKVMVTGRMVASRVSLGRIRLSQCDLKWGYHLYSVIVSHDSLSIVLHGYRILCHIISSSVMKYPVWSHIILSYLLWWGQGYLLKLVLLGKNTLPAIRALSQRSWWQGWWAVQESALGE